MNRETLGAAISAVMVAIINVCALFGFEVDGDALANVVYAALMLAATGWGVWHNHNFTAAAQAGQRLTDEIKGKHARGEDNDA